MGTQTEKIELTRKNPKHTHDKTSNTLRTVEAANRYRAVTEKDYRRKESWRHDVDATERERERRRK